MGFFKNWLGVLFVVQVSLYVGRLFTSETMYAFVARLSEVTYLQFFMVLGSWFFLTKRLGPCSMKVDPQFRCALRLCFLAVAVSAQIAYAFFYIDFYEDSWLVYICFLSVAFYIHLILLSVAFYIVEQIARRVLPDSLSIFVSNTTLHTLMSFLIALTLTTYCLAVTHQAPVVQHVDIPIKNLPSRFDGFSIALLTDVHIGPTVSKKRVEEIVTIVNRLNVDSVSIAGDLVDGFLEHIRYKAMPLKQLKSKYGTFYTTGNHELYHGGIFSLIAYLKNDIGLTVLQNEHKLIRKDDDVLCFAGVNDIKANSLNYKEYKMDAEKALSGCPNDSTVVLLVHQPNAAYKILELSRMSRRKVDLVLSGHTHYGQFYLLRPMAYLNNKFLHGYYEHYDTHIYVSAGVNYWGPPVKTTCEIILIRLRAQ